MCLIVGYVLLFFGGILIFESVGGMLTLVSFILATIITVFMEQESKIEELKKSIQQLEEKKEGKQ
jgi:hypothetical protein